MPQFSKKIAIRFLTVAKSHTIKAYLHFCLDEEDSFKDELDYY